MQTTRDSRSSAGGEQAGKWALTFFDGSGNDIFKR
jgi:hypothetical protein